ncbi:MAG: alpha/beta hydrolase [Pseudomonadota bacterium]
MEKAPVILLLHAITRSAADYNTFVASIDGEFDTIAPNLLGHGQQNRSARYQLADYRDALLRQIPAAGDLVLWGHSLGGLVALVDHLESRVTGIVLEDVPLFEVDWPRFRDGPFYEGFRYLHERLSQGVHDAADLINEVAGWPSGKGEKTFAEHFGMDGVKQRATELMSLDPRTLEPPMTGQITGDLDVRTMLSKAQCPVCLLAGHRDIGSALTEGDLVEYRRVCPAGAVQQFGNLGHDIRMFEQRACAKVLRTLATR